MIRLVGFARENPCSSLDERVISPAAEQIVFGLAALQAVPAGLAEE